MRFYDTAQKGCVTFIPDQKVRMYVCGITPYDSAHLGHIFTFMIYDLMERRLEEQGHTVQLVRNITDVDEPIFKKAGELGITYTELAEREIRAFQTVMRQLNFCTPQNEPKASEFIEPMATAVQQLLDNGFAYRLDNDIYYDTSRDASFGTFSGLSHTLQLRIMAMRGGDPKRPGKRQPLDFLLWRGIRDATDLAAWDTALGHGRPGWHIECSAMSTALLGLPFDIHGGGDDLIFPHHEAEIAQAYGLGQPEVARHWLHVAPLLLFGEKMSKSLGNLVFAQDLLKDYEPAVIRLALMHYHYRSGGEWRPELLHDSRELWADMRRVLPVMSKAAAEKLLARVREQLDDNLNTPYIIGVMKDTMHKAMQDKRSASDSKQQQTLLCLLGLQ